MSDSIKEINDQSFESDVLKATGLVMVDFWAQWCGPCKNLAPHLEVLAKSYAANLKICKLDVDSNDESAIKYGIQSVPTLIFFKNGKEIARVSGADLAKIKQTIDKNIE